MIKVVHLDKREDTLTIGIDMKDDLREILFMERWSIKMLSEQLFITPNYVSKSLLRKKRKYPLWVRAFVVAYKLGKLTGLNEADKSNPAQ